MALTTLEQKPAGGAGSKRTGGLQAVPVRATPMQLDVTALVTLDALLTEGSVTAAAQRLNLSVPATSRRLGRLREIVNDQLFVQAGRGLVPTPRAIELQGRVRSLLEDLHGVLAQPAVPIGKLERTFNLRTTDGFARIWARLLGRVREEAPLVCLCFHPHLEGVAALRDRSVDLEITVLKETGPEVFKQHLFSDRYIGIAALNHPLLVSGTVTPESYVRYPHISASRRGFAYGPIDRALAVLGLRRGVAMVTPDFQSALVATATSELLTAVPLSVAMLARETIPLRVFELPVPTPRLEVSQVWHPRSNGDAAHKWLRRHVLASFECYRNLAAIHVTL